MAGSDRIDFDVTCPPFDQLKGTRLLAAARSGRTSVDHARHRLYAAFDKRSASNVLVKVTAKPGVVYQNNLANEIASLTTINHALPDSRYFPTVKAHGALADSRVFLMTTLFDEFPLATSIEAERNPGRMVAHLRAVLEIAHALDSLHSLSIFHVDLNPMNILYRVEAGRPVIRVVDFESSYEQARHGAGLFYDPPTTPGYAAPELASRAPDARADLFSLGAVLYTMLAGHGWSWRGDAAACVEGDRELDPELRTILLGAVRMDPDRRYPSVRAFREALASYLERIWPGRDW
jgi:serine/threonine protein kinase